MREISVQNDVERHSRTLDIAGMDSDQRVRDRQAKRANAGFTQVSTKGWARITELISKNPQVAKTYCFLASHVSGETNAVTVNQESGAVAASSAVMLVAVPSMVIISVKSSRTSF